MRIRALLSASLLVLLVACGGTDDEGSGLVTVDEGGTIEIGSTTIVIPPNALTEDTEVVVSYASLDDYGVLENGRDRVLVFDPPMSLTESATITIDPGNPRPDAQQQYGSVYQFSDGDWRGLDVSTIIDADGNVQSGVSWLGPTAVVIVDIPIDS